MLRKAVTLTPLEQGFLVVVRYRDSVGKHVETKKVATAGEVGTFVESVLSKAVTPESLPG